MKCKSGSYEKDVIRTNGSSTCIAITAAAATPSPGTTPAAGSGLPTTHSNPAVASCMKTGTIADCAHIGLCKNDNDFTPDVTLMPNGENCKISLQYLLSKFQEAGQTTYLAWADITCSEIESKTYQDAGSTETKKMADVLELWSSLCCGGKDKMKLPCSTATSNCSARTNNICKAGADFKCTTECLGRNTAMLQRTTEASWDLVTPGVKCDAIAGRKDSFYEHTTFGTQCCGARSKVRCLDSSSMCATDADYQAEYADAAWDGKTCAFWDGMVLSMFDGNKLNWATVTSQEMGCTTWDHTRMDLRAKGVAADASIASVVAGALGGCCGGKGTKTGVATCVTPLAKAPADTKHFVEVAVTMPYTEDEFKAPAVQASFKKAVASAAGTVPDNVVIVSVKSARRRSSSVVVQTKILAKDAAAVDTMKTTLGSGDALKTKLNTALKKEGLKESTGVTAPATGSTAARSTASPAQMLVAALSLAVFARM